MTNKRVYGAVGVFAALAVALAGCGSDGDSGDGASSAAAPPAASSAPAESSSSEAMAGGDQFGAGCSAVPKTGKGSFDGMSTDPVATAASNNPALSTLVKAVGAADLVDTLNNQKAIMVFAPANSAFAKIPAGTLKKVLADKKTLTKILTLHVVAGKLSPEQVVGSHKTLEGSTIKVTGSAPNLKVGPKGTDATVVCGNVQTANATVYIIDTVMMPTS